MEIPEFKRGDVGDKLTAVANADLTGWTARFLVKLETNLSADPIVLNAVITETGETSTVEHTMDGTLAAGDYVAEVEVMRGDEGPFTFPNRNTRVRFRVNQDLG